MNQLQEAIKLYNSKGFNVIPLSSNSKLPLKGFPLERYFKEKYPVESLLKLAESKDINIGIIAGETSGVTIIDVDEAGKNLAYQSSYPTEWVESTPSGGRHLYYEWDGTDSIRKIDGGDYYSGNHYVVVSPSRVGGIGYEWLKPVSANIPLGKPPVVSVPKIEIQSGKYTRKEIYGLINAAMTSGLVEGQWNDTILYGSMVLAGDDWNKESVLALVSSWNKGKRPIPDAQLRGMVERGFEYASKNKYDKELPQSKKAGVQLNIRSYVDMEAKYAGYEPTWIIEGWLLDSAIITLAAPPERYKTWISIDLALSIATGLPFLDSYDVNRTGNVLILQQEDFGARYFTRFKVIERAKLARAKIPLELREDDQGNFEIISTYDVSDKIYFHEDSEFTLDNDTAVEKLHERIVETNAVLVIIDPFYSLSANDEYFAKTAEKIRDRIKHIRNETGCAFVFIHHTRKSGSDDSGDKLNRAQIFGSTFVSAVMEGTWMAGRISGLGRTQVVVARSFKDDMAQPETLLTFNINTRSSTDEGAYSVDVEDISEDLLNELKQHLKDHGAQSASELFEAFQDRFTSRGAFVRWLGKQVGNGIEHGDGKRGKYSISPDAG